jgi:NAD(P)-dependent dehydrogenase (short-subunit alcohol dehydrogenase family)
MGRLVTPDEIASAIIFLASPLQASITGTTLNVDGGMHSLRIPK